MPQPIPDEALDDRLGFVGTAGSGKSYNAMARVERLLARKARVCNVDPLGVFWGLRLAADGKSPSGFNIPIFGGPHGDLPLTEHSGALIGETVAGMAESCIIDLSEIGTKAGERRFMLHFLTALYRKASGEPLHLVIDEADMFAPQRLSDKDGEAAKLLGMMETVVRRGRIKGFIPWLITQRPAVLSKDVLSQVDGLVAFKLTSSQDRDALSAWVEGTADKDDWKAMRGELPTLERGTGMVWIPARGIFEKTAFPPKATFDSSRTPKRGEKKLTGQLQPLDLDWLKKRLSSIDAETKANDPRALKARIAELERQAKAPAVTVDTNAIAEARRIGFGEGYAKGIAAGRSHILGVLGDLKTDIEAALQKHSNEATRLFNKAVDESQSGSPTIPGSTPKRTPTVPPVVRNPIPAASGNGSLPKGERIILAAVAQRHHGMTRAHLTVQTGYKRSSRDAYIQRLKEKGYVSSDGADRIVATRDGIQALGHHDPLPTGAALQQYVLSNLPAGESTILGKLIEVYPDGIERDTLSDLTGYKRSSRDAYIQRLSTRELVDTSRGGIVSASADLFA